MLTLGVNVKSQIVDSLSWDTTMFAWGSVDGAADMVTCGESGFILYGAEQNTGSSGMGMFFTSKNFLLCHFDTAFRQTTTVVNLPFRVLDVYKYVNGNIVYFLVMPQMAKTREAALITYDVSRKSATTRIIYDRWMLRQNLRFIVANNFLYLTFREGDLNRSPATGDVTGSSYWPIMKVFDLSLAKVFGKDVVLEDVDGHYLSSVDLIHTSNLSDHVYVHLVYIPKKSKRNLATDVSKVAVFQDGKVTMSAIIDPPKFIFRNPYVLSCGRINFFEYNTPGQPSGLRYSYLSGSNFYAGALDVSGADCQPDIRYSVYFHELDSLGWVTDHSVHIQRFGDKGIAFDTIISPFKPKEVRAEPLPDYIMINPNEKSKLQFVVSSWQRLYCYELLSDNRVVEKYNLSTTLHMKSGMTSLYGRPVSRDQELMLRQRRADIGSTFHLQYAYAGYFYLYALTIPENSTQLSLKLYKCRF